MMADRLNTGKFPTTNPNILNYHWPKDAFSTELTFKSIAQLEAMLYEEEKMEHYEKCSLIRDEIERRLF